MSQVERCELAPGLEISRALIGLWQVADLERDGSVDLHEAALAMRPYVEAGFTSFDMADHYGSAEDIAGLYRARAGTTSDVQLLTKWVPQPGSHSVEEVRSALQTSLDRLQRDSIDLLQFHAWRYSDATWLDSLFALQELKQKGRVHHLGVTNFDTPHLAMALHSGIELVSNQVCYSLIDERPAGAMTEFCLTHGIGLLAFGTLAGGFLTERWVGQPEPAIENLDTWSQMKYKRFINVAGGWEPFQGLLNAIQEVARKHRVSMANVVCRSILDRPAVAGVIIGARLGKSDHIADNVRLFSLSLDEEDENRLRTASAALEPIPGNPGDEYRRPPFLTASGDLSHHLKGFPPPYEVLTREFGRSHALSGTVWEELAGFSRAVRKGDRILVSGTTATHRDRIIGGGDPASQTHFVIDKIKGAIESLGGSLDDVIRTRIYIRNEVDWEVISRVHGLRFGSIGPANTLIKADIIGEDYLVEMEAEAQVH